MPARKPQINFQVEPSMKVLYEEAKGAGHWVTRLCAAGFLLMVEDPAARQHALSRLRAWEAEFESADEDTVRAFVAGAQAALQAPAPGTPPKRTSRRAKTKAKRGRSG